MHSGSEDVWNGSPIAHLLCKDKQACKLISSIQNNYSSGCFS